MNDYMNMKNYEPKPIDMSDMKLDEELVELREAIAEHAHDVWAVKRLEEGWTYGEKLDREKMHHPDLVPYKQLPESEKDMDREMAVNTIKLLMKLGYDLVRSNETELYRHLMKRMRETVTIYKCSKCGSVVLKHDVFCSGCGKQLNIDWENK